MTVYLLLLQPADYLDQLQLGYICLKLVYRHAVIRRWMRLPDVAPSHLR